MTFDRWIIVAFFVGVVFGMIAKPEPKYLAAIMDKAATVDVVIGRCQARYPNKECVLVSMPVDND